MDPVQYSGSDRAAQQALQHPFDQKRPKDVLFARSDQAQDLELILACVHHKVNGVGDQKQRCDHRRHAKSHA